jgi:nitroreductase
MKIDEIIRNRRSITSFKPDPVSTEEIIDLLEVAKWAPNHKMTEPWRFLLYNGEGTETFVQAFIDAQPAPNGEVSEGVKRKADHFRSIPAHLVVVMPEDPRQKTWDEDHAAVSALIQNFQLAAWARDIGMIWRSNDWIYNPAFREKIGVKPGEKIVATLMLGYIKDVPKAKKRTDVREKLTIIDQHQ